jgi:hypothetical protein
MPLSRMYNAGVQMNLASLYPRVVFPVPRGTHMISPLIQWDHSAEWTVPKLGFKTRKVFVFVRFQVLTVVSVKMAVFWDVALCSLV